MHTPTRTSSVACCFQLLKSGKRHTHFIFQHFAFDIRTISLQLQLKLIFIELLCFLVYSFAHWRRLFVVVCLPGIENSLRPLEIAPYDLLSKLSIALIIVAGTEITHAHTMH